MLVDTQRRFTRVCLARDVPEEDLEALGGLRERWLLYRHMVRTRLREMLETALRRTVEALGADAWRRWFDRWLDEAPPRTRYIREVAPAFAAFALPRLGEDATIPAWVPDLLRLEATRFELGYLDAPAPAAGEFAFEKVPVVNPAARVLRLRHPVHRKAESYEQQPVQLCVYRRADDRTAVWAVDDFTATLLEAFQAGDRPVTDLVKDVAARLEVPIDEKLVTRLGTLLAGLIERGILLGGR